jgi:hypothetical protein
MRSSSIIDYRLRPSKSIERKMFLDCFRCLNHHFKIKDYQYIGFGGNYFIDFYCMHKELHIEKLINIEANESNQNRFKFNAPFDFMDLEFGNSWDILPTLDYSSKTIAWLDYDGWFDSTILTDIETLIDKFKSGSIFLVSFNESVDGHLPEDKISFIKKNFGDYAPYKIDKKEVAPKNIHSLYYKILDKFIKKCSDNRENINYEQLFFFRYNDNSPMMTLGGILYSNEDVDKLRKSQLQNLSFIRNSDKYYSIDVPFLTQREIAKLNQNLNLECYRRLSSETGVGIDKIKQYNDLYKYYSCYSEFFNLLSYI